MSGLSVVSSPPPGLLLPGDWCPLVIAQAMFMMRFVIQWIASERVGRSIVPVAFWFFSVAGGSLLLIYAIQRQDPVFIAGQGLGLLIYFRNLWLIFKEKRNDPTI